MNTLLVIFAVGWTIYELIRSARYHREAQRHEAERRLILAAEANRAGLLASVDELVPRETWAQAADAEAVDAFLRDDLAHPWHR